MYKHLLSILFIIVSATCVAQTSAFTILFPDYNVGIIHQEDTTVTYTFEFCNEGTDTIYIKRIEPTCLFTIKEYTDSAILPDMPAILTAELNTSNIFGKFSKDIYVYGNMPTIKLSISGERRAIPTYNNEDYSQTPDNKSSNVKKSKKKRNKK